MRILMACEDIPHPHLGGLGKHVLALSQALAERGHQVDILGNGIHPIGALAEQAGPGKFFGEIVGHERLWKQRQLGLFHWPAQRLNARGLLKPLLERAAAYDLVHYHGHMPWLAAAVPDHVAFIQTRHDQGGDCMLKTRYSRVGELCKTVDARACASCATANPNLLQRNISTAAVDTMRRETETGYERHPVVFVSDFLRQGFARAVGRDVQGTVIHNAVDTRKLAQAKAGGEERPAMAALRLFSAGAMFPYKGYRQLLEALSALPESAQPFQLKIAGSGPQEAQLRERYASAQVEFLGWSSYEQVLAQVLAADAVLVPSVCEEPCATTILEALALGKTVYALRNGGTPEMLPHAQSAGGRLVLADSMAELARNALAHQSSAPVTLLQPSDFTIGIAQMTDALEAQYRQIIENKRA